MGKLKILSWLRRGESDANPQDAAVFSWTVSFCLHLTMLITLLVIAWIFPPQGISGEQGVSVDLTLLQPGASLPEGGFSDGAGTEHKVGLYPPNGDPAHTPDAAANETDVPDLSFGGVDDLIRSTDAVIAESKFPGIDAPISTTGPGAKAPARSPRDSKGKQSRGGRKGAAPKDGLVAGTPGIPDGAGTGVGGTGSGAPGVGGTGRGRVGFFGSEEAGGSVVFVVDMSRSMEQGNRFTRAKQELIRSISNLRPPQYFSVVFFNHDAYPLFYPDSARALVPANAEMRSRAIQWIGTVETGRFTVPEPALRFAIGLEPEVIYFLTDGEFPSACRDIVKEINLKHAAIHTIAFQSREGELTLQAIAADNNGTYRFVK